METIQLAKLCNIPYYKRKNYDGKIVKWKSIFWENDGKANILKYENNTIIVIRGTHTKTNLNVALDTSYVKQNGINLHKGFLESSVALENILKTSVDKETDLYLCGHSAGGAVACITGYLLSLQGINVDKIVTLGMPKITDDHGAFVMDNVLDVTRFTTNYDPINSLPFYGTHFGKHVNIKTSLPTSFFKNHTLKEYIKNIDSV